MLKIFIVTKDTDLQSLSSTLMDARFRGAQADAALARLKALNPHVDLGKLQAGAALIIPDSPGFKASAGASPQAGLLDEFRALVSGALSDATTRMRAAAEQRARERADVAAAFKSDSFSRVAAGGKDLAQQASEALKMLAAEESGDKAAAETVATMSKAALSVLAQIGKVLG